MTNREEIERRRTFAIISHPDAGKTTLTEKLLLYGGAINQAGSVKGKQSAKHAVSDWMDIEKAAWYFRHLLGAAVQLRGQVRQYSGYPGPSGLLGGYLPHPDGSGLGGHGHRRRQGR